jgi:ribosomal protein S12 methylthiotransferase
LKTKASGRINVVSLGCSKNLVDSELLMGQLRSSGFNVQFESEEDAADVVVINTCGFVNDAKQESIDTILRYIQAKEKGLINQVYVIGCLSERYINELKAEIPEVDKYFGVNRLKEVVNEIGGQYKKELHGERLLTTPSHYAYLKISEGCNRNCTFCAIPSIRGKHISRPIEDITGEAEMLVRGGVKELILIAQDLTFYGLDLYHKNSITLLLESLSAIKGLEWIRLHYTYPAGFPDDLIQVIRDRDNVCKYIDIPIQHINNRILSLMQRGHSTQATENLLSKIRKNIPHAAVRTTVIVGFPGETREEFNELTRFIEEFEFDRLGVFAYSAEEGTKAYKLPDNISPDEKLRRVEKLMEIQQSVSLRLNNRRIGQTFKTIIDSKEGDYFIGRTEFDSPEVDNEVLIKADKILPEIGKLYSVTIHKADYFDLFGTISHF